jgi:hypothetical protein
VSADKPIQRYNHDLFMDPDGAWVSHDDHLAAIRKARAEAFEDIERALRSEMFCESADLVRGIAYEERTQ